MLKRGDNGPAVKDLQAKLLALGVGLPRWGVDGDLGEETIEAVSQVLRGYIAQPGVKKDDVISDVELGIINRLYSARRLTIVELPDGYYDCRPRAKREVDRGPRAWSNVRGITLHQTACSMGENAPRYDAIGAHVVVTRAGKVFHMHDFDRIVWHGNGFNSQTVGVEIDGLYAGVEGDLTTVWDDPSTKRREQPVPLLEATARAARETVRWIIQEVRRHGGQVAQLLAHRQSSGSRRNDPGSEIWQQVAMPLIAELDLSDGGTGFKIANGRPIPSAWDSDKKDTPY